MRIERPELISTGTHVTLQARVTGGRHRDVPERLWFRYPADCEPLLSAGIEPFVVALSSVASASGEPLEVDVPMWEVLHANLEEYWAVFHCWEPRRFHRVRVTCPGFAPESFRGEATGTAFSGGVDSFFTLFRRAADREPHSSLRITYAVYVHGFDVPLSDQATYDVSSAAYAKSLARLNCVRTMMVLASLNVLESFPTFPPVKSMRVFMKGSWQTPRERLFGRQTIVRAAAGGRHALAWTGRLAMARSRLKMALGYTSQ